VFGVGIILFLGCFCILWWFCSIVGAWWFFGFLGISGICGVNLRILVIFVCFWGYFSVLWCVLLFVAICGVCVCW